LYLASLTARHKDGLLKHNIKYFGYHQQTQTPALLRVGHLFDPVSTGIMTGNSRYLDSLLDPEEDRAFDLDSEDLSFFAFSLVILSSARRMSSSCSWTAL